jgi:GAF domain-containing protein
MTALTQDVVADLRRRIAELEQKLQSSLGERDEAIAQQAASAEVLQVINASPGDLAPVFDAIVEKATQLCDAAGGALWLIDGDMARATGGRGGKMPEAFYEYVEHESVPVKYLLGRDQDRPFVHVVDLKATKPYQDGIPFFVANVDLGGVRTSLSVPLNEAGSIVGIFTLIRREVRPFTDKQIALVQSFAAQAQIAMKNARLLSDLRTARDRQAASAEILRAIASTPGDAERPLQQIAETTARLFGASSVTLNIARGDEWARTIRVGPSSQRVGSEVPAADLRIGARNLPGTVFRENRQIHIPDLDHVDPAIADWPALPHARAAGARAMAGTPLRREGKAVGALVVHRHRPAPFTDEELALLQSFADQAVIAIENARLFNETKEALERQTATADILKVIASSPSDVQPVFDAIAASANRLIGGYSTSVLSIVDDTLHLSALTPTSPAADAALKASFPRLLSTQPWAEPTRKGEIVHVPDIETESAVPAHLREVWRMRGFRSFILVPLRRDRASIGMISVTRKEPGAFAAHHVQLLQTFADQAVIAIENTRLFNETREALERQTATADILKVIASSPSDVQPVFEAIAERSNRLVEGLSTGVYRLVDDTLHLMAFTRISPQADAVLEASYPRPLSSLPWGDQMRRGELVHVRDAEVELAEVPALREMARQRGWRSSLLVPLLRDRAPIGLISVTHKEPGTFAAHHVQLLQTFADQAVIAIENVRLFNETREALERQTATADILKVIASSPSDVQPVFEAIATSANRLLGGLSTAVFRFVDGVSHLAAFTPFTPAADEILKASFPRRIELAQAGETVQITDTETSTDAQIRDIARARGFRSVLLSPLMSKGASIGRISVTRTETGSFADHHVQLLQTFADQAVIAIENTRLFNETQEALEHQTATSEVLQVIGSSMADAQPVFERILDITLRLFDSEGVAIFLAPDDGLLHLVARRGGDTPAAAGVLESIDAVYPLPIDQTAAPSVIGERQQRYFPDVMNGANVPQSLRRAAQVMGNFSVVITPMLWEGRGVGMISVTREPNAAFNAKELGLLRTFADQAVIAIENARLFNEVQARTEDLRESLQQQTATADVLKVISRSAFDLDAVLATLVESAATLCEAERGLIFLRQENQLRVAANYGFSPELEAFARANPLPIDGRSTTARAAASGVAVQAVDLLADETQGELALQYQRLGGHRTNLGVPLRREGETIGVFTLTRQEVRPFTEKQIELVSTFADQAVIAISNVRLFEEVQARTEDLRESLQRQTATADVLKVISRSAFDLQPVLDTLTESAARLCNADMAAIARQDARGFYHATNYNFSVDWVKVTDAFRLQPERGSVIGRVLLAGAAVQIPDVLADPGYAYPDMQKAAGYRTLLGVPLLRGKEPIGLLFLGRKTVEPFTEKQVELVSTFADQAVIAIENVRLFDEVQAKTRELSEALTYQTGSSNILGVIASSPTDVAPVLEAIVKSACELCDAYDATVLLRDGDDLRISEHHGPIPIGLEKWPINRYWTAGRALLDQKPVHVPDLLSDEGADFPDGRELSRRMGHRSILSVPLLREGESIGAIVLRRTEVQPFSDKQIALLQTFADQAVIAIGNVRLFEEVQAKTADLQESLQQQTATADVLKVISRSTFDLQTVLETLVESAARLCEADKAFVYQRDAGVHRLAATYGYPVDYKDFMKKRPIEPGRGTLIGRTVLEASIVHIPDVLVDPEYNWHEAQERGGYRTMLGVPMLREGVPIGVFAMNRSTVKPFTNKQIALLQTFSDQAVIAIENVRLFEEVQAKTRELTEALTYQTGSSNILSVIASSPTDVAPVLKAIVESACELCEADDALVVLKDGDDLIFGAQHGSIPVVWQRQPASRRMVSGRAVADGRPVHVHDLLAPEGDEFPDAREFARKTNVRTVLCVPLLRENEGIGSIVLRRTAVQPFSDKQIGLLQTFADQAVIAIGNVRLFDEVQAKTRDLTEALTYQTGSGNILRVIASSPTDVGPVLNAIVESASELCEAYDAVVLLKDGDELRFSAHHGPIPINIEKWPISRGWTAGRAFVDQGPVHVRDLLSDEGADFPDGRELSRIAGLPDSVRTILSVPLLREKESIGAILLRRTEVEPFSEKQIALLQTFADQAVIAIGNVRLFDEVQAKTRDLTESLQQQTATADVLKVISRSTFDLPAVLQTLVESAARLCDADKTIITREKNGAFYRAEAYGFSPEFREYAKDNPIEAGRGSSFGRALLEGRVVHIPDVLADPEYTYLKGQRLGDYRTVLTVPMLREGIPIGVLSLTRTEVRPFTTKQIELATTFADQAAIAIENVRLFDSVEARTRELAKSLEDLRTAQDRLVQTQKLASLGQLTAGIAHEIKNPLNFVNNFSALSAELTDELNDLLKPAALNDKLRQEVDELTRLLKDNLEKVVQHGKRADSIVKNMLLHSREGSGEHRPTDINALLDESLNLAYHGARAEKREFNITLQRDFDEMAGAVDLFPQEITRAFLNLISNGFYAANKRKREIGLGFEPVLHATTRDLGASVEIRIRDNGSGIPAEVREKMFNPFFTTKPAGEGTGLGLSMSHDIIVKQHGGMIDVDTEPGEYTEFRIILPRTSNLANKTRGQT